MQQDDDEDKGNLQSGSKVNTGLQTGQVEGGKRRNLSNKREREDDHGHTPEVNTVWRSSFTQHLGF